MGDGYWNHSQAPLYNPADSLKRHRTEFVLPPSGLTATHEMHSYLAQNDDPGGPQPFKDTKSLGSAYDHFLRSLRLPSEEGSRSTQVGFRRAVCDDAPDFLMRDPVAMGFTESFGPELAPNGRVVSFDAPFPTDTVSRPRETLPLPPDATKTVYIEGLPPSSTRREVAHIFRPFVGYKEVRLVRKESKHRGGDPVTLCFVDFIDPACAATALSALQGYKMDEHDPDSNDLRLQFSKFPGPRSTSGSRGRR